MATFFSCINFKDFPDKFLIASSSFQQIIEFLFSEMYQIEGNSSVYSQEELKLISSKAMEALKKLVLQYIKTNNQALRLEAEEIEVSVYFTVDDSFEPKPPLPIPTNSLIKASFVKFLGNLIAKVDFAHIYAQKLDHSGTITILKELQSLMKPFHDLVFKDPLKILESEAQLFEYFKYRGLCQQPEQEKCLVNLHATVTVSDNPITVWDGYGSILCIYILRNVLPLRGAQIISPLKLLKLVVAGMSAIPQDYQGGIEYFLPVLKNLLNKLQASQLLLENKNEHNCFLDDFILTLHTIDFPNTKEAYEVIRELTEHLFFMTSRQNRYLTLVKVQDMMTEPKRFCTSKAFTAALSSVYVKEVKHALSRNVTIPELFLRDTPLLRFIEVMLHADPKQTGNIASSNLYLTSNSTHPRHHEDFDREER
jgi:hypothetical protein